MYTVFEEFKDDCVRVYIFLDFPEVLNSVLMRKCHHSLAQSCALLRG